MYYKWFFYTENQLRSVRKFEKEIRCNNNITQVIKTLESVKLAVKLKTLHRNVKMSALKRLSKFLSS